MLTAQGLEELKIALAPEHVGFVLEKLETLAFQTTFNPRTRTGLVPVNTSLIARDKFKEALTIIDEAYNGGFCISEFIAVANTGEKLGSVLFRKVRWALAQYAVLWLTEFYRNQVCRYPQNSVAC